MTKVYSVGNRFSFASVVGNDTRNSYASRTKEYPTYENSH